MLRRRLYLDHLKLWDHHTSDRVVEASEVSIDEGILSYCSLFSYKSL